MKHFTPLLALLLAVSLPANVLAQPRVIGDLSDGALLGQIRDTAQLQRDFSSQETLLADASRDLGLSSAEFTEVQHDIAQGRARYVEIPRRLNGMAGQHGGKAFAVHDVVIPTHTYGWEVDLQRPANVVRVFMPNRCGNISYLLSPRLHTVAALKNHVRPPFAQPVAIVTTPVSAPTIAPEVTPLPAAVGVTQAVPQTPTPAAHHFRVLPWLALGLIGLALAHGGGGGGITTGRAPAAPPVPVPTPAPIHTACPSVVHR